MSLANALSFVLKWEGGYVNDPADPGGATNKGITQRTYDAYRRDEKMAPQDVRKIADEEVHDIYRTRYYDACSCSTLSPDMEVAVFDTAVNMGPTVAKTLLQQSNGNLYTFLQLRMIRYDNIIKARPTSAKFRKGWFNRVADLRRFAEQAKKDES